MRVALVHDWLTGMRGGEKALEVLCDAFPDADVLTLVHIPGSVSPAISRHRIRTSVLQHVPAIGRVYRQLLPVFPVAIELLDLDGYDLIVSTSHCAAKAVVASPAIPHLCYCFTPMRYAWDQRDQYFGPDRIGRPAAAVARPILRRLARWDASTSGRVSRYVAISHYVAGRIARYYNRRSDVVYPPVDTEFFSPDGRPAAGYAAVVSALVPYKRLELAIDAARIVGMPLKIVGQGPERARLEAHAAGADVSFLGFQPDEIVRDIYRGASAVLLPGEEDFGIVPVEAQACGRPVVALARGGARETVKDRVTGILVAEPTPEAMAAGLAAAISLPFSPDIIRAHAAAFSRTRFRSDITRVIDDTLQQAPGTRW